MPGEPTPQPAKTDRERMVGNWFIVNDDSQRKGDMCVITDDSILMNPTHGVINVFTTPTDLTPAITPSRSTSPFRASMARSSA